MGDHHYVMKEEVVGCLDLQKKKNGNLESRKFESMLT